METDWSPLSIVLGGGGIAGLAILVLRFILSQAAGVTTDKHKSRGEVVVHEGYAALIKSLRDEVERATAEIERVRAMCEACDARHRERDEKDDERDMEIALLKSKIPQQ